MPTRLIEAGGAHRLRRSGRLRGRHGGIVFQRLAAVTIGDTTALQEVSTALEGADTLGSVIPLFASVSERDLQMGVI
ncbi:hypothetical protein, partial [Mesorhizobium sp. M7A.F.Ca.CA.004.09.1.2]|uniref:hypothetical protein n=1 Tax=Mesorhizobium sp. M7A.F.Ca.CA.004.09.1.2 TaxID=2496695 RepID=UPI0019D0EA1C